MTSVYVLDTGPVGQIVHPRANPALIHWFRTMLNAGSAVVLPEIADYELRRNFLLEIARGRIQTQSLTRLDELRRTLTYLPINSEAMRAAAQLWADARLQGQPTSDDHALDGDVILAAQAIQVNGIVVTDNPKHLSQFVSTTDWRELL